MDLTLVETPKFDALLAELPALGITPDNAVLLGSACFAIRKWRDVNDLDVLVPMHIAMRLADSYSTDERVHELRARGSAYAYAVMTDAGVIQISHRLEDFVSDVSVTEEEIRQSVEPWNGWQVLDLDLCCKIKVQAGRDKDRDDLELVHNHKLAMTATQALSEE